MWHLTKKHTIRKKKKRKHEDERSGKWKTKLTSATGEASSQNIPPGNCRKATAVSVVCTGIFPMNGTVPGT